MDKTDYRFTELWAETVDLMQRHGLLLVSADAAGKPNTMTIGWATLGIVWRKPILAVLVRPSRFTYRLIDSLNDFTVNVPPPEMAKTVAYCGTVSGRDHDKFAERGLTAQAARRVTSPIIDECILHYECKVVHKHDVDPKTFVPEIVQMAYPRGDFHRVFYGEVLATYGVPDFRARAGQSPR